MNTAKIFNVRQTKRGDYAVTGFNPDAVLARFDLAEAANRDAEQRQREYAERAERDAQIMKKRAAFRADVRADELLARWTPVRSFEFDYCSRCEPNMYWHSAHRQQWHNDWERYRHLASLDFALKNALQNCDFEAYRAAAIAIEAVLVS